jgi:hypothetical protein
MDNDHLFECGGTRSKSSKALPAEKPYIWSSIFFLRSEEIIRRREQWFEEWLHKSLSHSKT